jgi:hypothetical protein
MIVLAVICAAAIFFVRKFRQKWQDSREAEEIRRRFNR